MFETGIPLIKPDDPEFVWINAAFYALSHPPSRRILELLAVGPNTAADLGRLTTSADIAKRCLNELVAVGFVSTSSSDRAQQVYRLDGPAMDRVRTWLAGFD